MLNKCKHYYDGESYIDDEDGNIFETCQLCGESKDTPED